MNCVWYIDGFLSLNVMFAYICGLMHIDLYNDLVVLDFFWVWCFRALHTWVYGLCSQIFFVSSCLIHVLRYHFVRKSVGWCSQWMIIVFWYIRTWQYCCYCYSSHIPYDMKCVTYSSFHDCSLILLYRKHGIGILRQCVWNTSYMLTFWFYFWFC